MPVGSVDTKGGPVSAPILMQEGDINDSFSRMRLQLLRDSQLSQMQRQQQGSGSISQSLGLNIQPDMWSNDAPASGHGQNGWGGHVNALSHTPGIGGPSGDKHSSNAPGNPEGPGASDARTTLSGDHAKADSAPEQSETGLWSGSPFGGISRSIWSGGECKALLLLLQQQHNQECSGVQLHGLS